MLAEQRLDVETLIAAILHDTIEDTPLTREAIASEFGDTVAELVDGVTKLDKLQFRDRQEAAAESFRKMLLAMARDLRVILIKLADRLHNMRTLGAQSAGSAPPHRPRDAGDLRADRATPRHEPDQGRAAGPRLPRAASVAACGDREAHPHAAGRAARSADADRGALAQRLTKEGFSYRLVGRIKSPWSIYSKMRAEQKTLDQVMDVFGFRIVVRTVPECYHALGVVHAVFKPLDGRFRDFIAIPKANGYQSLHTVLFGPYGSPIEVQIRTEEMDLIAERGIAAHWSYKHGGDDAEQRAEPRARSGSPTWSNRSARPVRRWSSSRTSRSTCSPTRSTCSRRRARSCRCRAMRPCSTSPTPCIPTSATTPSPRASTSKLVPLRTKLASGQTVEIITAKSSAPKPQWLEFVVSGKARTAIRHQLKHLEHEDAVQLGHRMLDRALETLDTSLDRLPPAAARSLPRASIATRAWKRCSPTSRSATACPRRWRRCWRARRRTRPTCSRRRRARCRRSDRPILITGSERGVISFANCCLPIPGDEIMGYHTAGRGIVVHRLECPNVAELPQVAGALGADRLGPRGHRRLPGRAADRSRQPPGRAGAGRRRDRARPNPTSTASNTSTSDANISVMRFAIEVHDRKHLADVIRRVRRLGVVHGVQRL